MKPLLVVLLALAGAASPARPQESATPPGAPKPAEEAKVQESAPADSPQPVVERNVTFQMDIGHRFVPDIGGDFNTYRSVVNLGSGPKLLGLESQIVDPSRRLFDRLNIGAHSWGGDPYNTLRLDMERAGAYRLMGDYRNIQYFNFLPSFANPNAPQSLLNQRSYDAQRRLSNVELELLPNRWLVPYFGLVRDDGSGRGVTPWVGEGNEYPVPTLLDDGTTLFRGGVRLEFRRFHASLEQGGGRFRDNQRIFSSARNPGNRLTPILGQQLFLGDLLQSYGVRGRNIFTKGILTAAPADWLHFYGSFIHSRPTSEINYTDRGSGLFLVGAGRFFNNFQTLLSAEAKMPRNSASAAVELRAGGWLRILDSFWTDRFHNASAALLAEQFLTGATVGEARNLFTPERLVVNYNRHQLEALLDVIPKITLRGGHRYVWGNALTPPSLVAALQPSRGEIRMNVALAGLTYRPSSKLFANVDYEGSPGDQNYFRTSLHNYHQLRSRVQAQLPASLRFASNFFFLDNKNPNTAPTPAQRIFADYTMRNYAISGSLQWLPKGGRKFSLLGEYTRSSLKSDVQFVAPHTLLPERSYYRDDGHMVTALVELRPRGATPGSPYLSFGGMLFRSGGSRPTNFYQPVSRLAIPVNATAEFYGEWRWYGMTQPLFLYEGFRTNMGVLGLRLSR